MDQITNPDFNFGQVWSDVLRPVLAENPQVGAFLEKGKLVVADREEVVVGFVPADAIALMRVNQEKSRWIIEQALMQFFGRPMIFRPFQFRPEDLRLPEEDHV